ncbi:hypothetical protein AB6E50_20680 [Vibrio cyclitrophicus]
MSKKSIEQYLTEIRELDEKLIKTLGKIIRANNGAMYHIDIFISAVVNRSLELSKGFESMINAKLF